MTTYSQKDEQDWVLRYCGPVGRFLDIGAYDGVQYSNTIALVEQGWSGIMVEPGLEAFQALHANHGDKPEVLCVHAVVIPSPADRLVQFWPNPRTFSTTRTANVEKFNHEGFGPYYWVPAITIRELLTRFPSWYQVLPIDVVSIDTEGTSLELLRSLPMDLIRPRVIVVEHDGCPDDAISWGDLQGYRSVMINEENIVLVWEDA